MFASTAARVALAVTAAVAVLAGAPALAAQIGSTPPGPMPVAWEQARAVDASAAQSSHAAVLKAERERRKAERARKKAERERRERAAAKRRAAEEKAARKRAAASQGGSPAQNRALGMQMCRQRGWSAGQCEDLGRLWDRESGWNHRAQNGSSGAYGIPQSLPGSKMSSHGGDWQTNPRTQIAWGLDYIASTYGNPSNAWGHSQSSGWY